MTEKYSKTLDEDYARAGFGGSLGRGQRRALVIVDVVAAYLDPESPLYAGVAAEEALASNIRLVNTAREHGVAVIFTNLQYDDEGKIGGLFYRKVDALKAFHADSPAGQFWPSLEPSPNEIVITKQYPSAFFATSLASMLHAMQLDAVLITGYSTSGCVRATAMDALCHGFIPLVVKEACADRDEGPHQANLFDIQAKIGEVISERDALKLLQL